MVLVTDRSGKDGLATGGLKGKVKKIATTLLKELDCAKHEISILLTTDEEIGELNSRYRDIDKPTDVLSFPMEDPELLGDVVISYERVLEQADRFGVTDDEELSRLLIHGTLHLLGFIHEHGGKEAAKMKKREAELMDVLKASSII
jgi:probable rRNA maturation factor